MEAGLAMRWPYLISLVLAGLLVASPVLFFLPGKEDRPQEIIIGWTSDGKAIRKKNPVVFYDSYSASVRSLDPVTCGDTTSAGVQANFYEGLYTYHYLKRPAWKHVVPQLAAEMPGISEDRLTYTIPIRRNVLYSRNPCFGRLPDERKYRTRAVTAHDFVLALKRVGDSHIDTNLSWAFLSERVRGIDDFHTRTRKYRKLDFSRYDKEHIEGVRALDDHTLQIRLVRPFPQLIYVLAMAVYAPCPREAIDYWMPRTGLAEFHRPESVVGTGPYLLHAFEAKNNIILVRNPDFREQYYPSEGEPRRVGDDGEATYAGDRELGLLDDAGKRVPFIDVKRYDWMEQTFSNWMTFLAKRKDIGGIPQQTFDFVVTPGKELTEEWKKKRIYMRKSEPPSVYWLGFNMRDPVLSSSRSLRQGLALGFDVESYVKVMFNDRGKRAVNIVPSSFPSHDAAGPGPYYRPVPGEVLEDKEAKKRYWQERIREAKRKIAHAREELGKAGKLDRNGDIPELVLDISRGDRDRLYGEIVEQQFRKVGVRLRVETNDWPTLQNKVHKGSIQMYSMGWHADYEDAENFLQLFYSPNIEKQTNSTCYSNPEFDRLFEKARVMPNTPERLELYVRMIRMISEDCPAVLLTEPFGFVLIHDWVRNVKPHPVGYGYFRYWRIDDALRRKLGGRS
jgi:ABC-type oligopeptide transport system substrate-binding subunit